MSKKTYILFLILFLTYINANESLDTYPKEMTIIKASGDLKENQKQQILTLSIFPPFRIKPENLTNIELEKGGKNYKPKTKCFHSEYVHDKTLIKCELDLSGISSGTYIISSFFYKKKMYFSRAKIEISQSEKKISDIKLINIVANNIYEYRKYQNLQLIFDKEVEVDKLNFIEIITNTKKRYKININCYIYNDELSCGSDISVKGGKYKINYVRYGDAIIETKDDLFLNIKDNIINLQSAYNCLGGSISNSRHNIICFSFDDNCENDYGYFTEFSFTNVRTHKTYHSYDHRRVHDSGTGYSSGEQFIFDFHEFEPGEYYINYVYKLRRYNTKFKINIEPLKPVDLSKIYQDLDDK